METPIIIQNRNQAGGDIVIDNIPGNIAWMQIDAECSSTPTAGSFAVLFKTAGMKKNKALLNGSVPVTIDAKNPYPIRVENLAITQLTSSPSGVDSDKTFSFSIVWEDA